MAFAFDVRLWIGLMESGVSRAKSQIAKAAKVQIGAPDKNMGLL